MKLFDTSMLEAFAETKIIKGSMMKFVSEKTDNCVRNIQNDYFAHHHMMSHFDAQKIYSYRKGEIACNKQFLLFSQCFLPSTYFSF